MREAISKNEKDKIIQYSEQTANAVLKAEEIKESLYKLRLKIIDQNNV